MAPTAKHRFIALRPSPSDARTYAANRSDFKRFAREPEKFDEDTPARSSAGLRIFYRSNRFSRLAAGTGFLLQKRNQASSPSQFCLGKRNEATASQLSVSKRGHFKQTPIESALIGSRLRAHSHFFWSLDAVRQQI